MRLLGSHHMATDIDPSDFMVAELKGRLLSAARLTWVGKGDAFLRPIVVAEKAQRMGFGRALVESFFGMSSSISVIARRDAVPFYERLGFTAADWSSVPGEYREECDCCDAMVQCQPLPMKWTSTTEKV